MVTLFPKMDGFPQCEQGQGFNVYKTGNGRQYWTPNQCWQETLVKTLCHQKVANSWCQGLEKSVSLLIFHRRRENFAGDVMNSGWGNVIFLIFTKDQYYLSGCLLAHLTQGGG